ncbi:uncharacterized protein LOC125496515 [Beta vulgaris subsp. vulgaris]|uniref:uncharacterized protein LOC125496515 n=1 Tax=Beta vulgaris subsp. vulgaris TaxID=3555 RepID=UPI00203696B2|nr:uncharacterized protein LOC125496515 [Beta vulgaris subsp. vulgaris]
MSVDFTDLNKACPKDNHALQKIVRLVVSTAGNELLSFMDARISPDPNGGKGPNTHDIRYSSRRILLQDNSLQAKKCRSYISLNNQQGFEEPLGRNIEVYVDDMIVTGKKSTNHVANLAETLSTLRRHVMKLTLKKCVFGVNRGSVSGSWWMKGELRLTPTK